MTIDARILDLLIQWEEEASAGRAVDLQQLAGGDPQLARRLQRHIDRLGKVAWLGREVDGESQIELPQRETLQTGMLLPDGVQLASLRENLEKSELLSPEVLAAAFETPHAANVYRLSAYLLDSELLTRFQLRAIAHGTTRGLILGRYMILDKLGEGGMGQVYRARHRRMDRIVALKVLPRDLMSQPHAIDRFNQEMQVAAQLHHRNIVRAYDADEAEGLHFFVMEYVAGSDLQSVVRSEGPLAPSQAIDCVLQAASGLEYAHGVGLVHRDIKPANLLLDGDGTVKILDMGIARLRQPNAEKASLTQDGMVMGTADFMAPEQAISSKSVTPQADIYSLGCTLYYILTGQPPFEGDTLITKLLAHREQEPPRLSAFRSDIPLSLERIYQRCMAKRPMERYLSAAELIDDLQRLQPQVKSLPAVRNAPSVLVPAAKADTAPTGLIEMLPRIGTSLLAETLEIVPPRRRPMLYGALACVALVLLAAIGWNLLPMTASSGSLAISIADDDFVAHLRDHELELINAKTNKPTKIKLISSQQIAALPAGRYRVVETDGEGMTADVAEFTIASGERTPLHLEWATVEEKRKMGEQLAVDATTADATPVVAEMPAASTPAESAPAITESAAEAPGQWKSIFNGKDLTGWTQSAGTKKWFVANGELNGTDATTALVSDRHDYQDFRLRMEAYLAEGVNSGISVRTATDSYDPKTFAYDGWVLRDSRYEFELHIPTNQQHDTIGTVFRVAGYKLTSYAAKNSQRVVQPNRWFQFELEAIGGKMAVYVDGRKVSEGIDPKPLGAGAIAFVNFFPVKDAAIRFRNIEIQELDAGVTTSESVPPPGAAGAALDRPWIDALSLVKFPDHAITGSWGRNGDSVIGLRTMNSRLMVPYALNGSYELEMEFTRLEGDDALGVHLPINESSCALVMSGFHGGPLGSGLRMVDGLELRDYPASSSAFAQGVMIVNGRRYQLALRVNVGASSDVAISARLNDQEILDWHGTSDQLSNSPQWALPMECALALLMYDSSYEIHSLRVRPLEGGQGVSLAHDWGTPFYPVADRPPDEIANQCSTWNGRTYFLSPNRMNLIESQKLARRLQGRLLTISSPEESAAIAEIAARKPIWTAGWRPSGNDPWRDERNRPLRFLPEWQAKQPDNWYGREAFLVVEMPGTNSNKGVTPLANDVMPHLKWLYPVIEWGEEYPDP
ncbi:protein kinase [Blastopirellula sp. JC732]|uniref:non-specific serine/threonine protein kinase n=1 Tax=Blastopirellula sediminis TaxID=2894196 RepID=A0A9X1MPL3_9BACT|nr:protein kinase [Blastopirellula sediminis]MCC9606110.1 protein kinase [Blastopirellula sediminis]MCC9630591.1 protein kinase [Blastopirellula sediminis]